MTSHHFLLTHPDAARAAAAVTQADQPPEVPPGAADWRARLRVAARAIVQLLHGILPGTLRSSPPGPEQLDETVEPPLVSVTADDPLRCAACREQAEHAVSLQVALAGTLADLLDGDDGEYTPAAARVAASGLVHPWLLRQGEDELLQPGSWAYGVLVRRTAQLLTDRWPEVQAVAEALGPPGELDPLDLLEAAVPVLLDKGGGLTEELRLLLRCLLVEPPPELVGRGLAVVPENDRDSACDSAASVRLPPCLNDEVRRRLEALWALVEAAEAGPGPAGQVFEPVLAALDALPAAA